MKSVAVGLFCAACGSGRGGGPVTIEARDAELLAFQDGDGPWRQLELVDGVAEVTSEEAFFAIARICPTLGGPDTDPAFLGAVDVLFDTRSRTYLLDCPTSDGAPRSTLSGATSPDAVVFAAHVAAFAGAGTYSLRAPQGTFDVVAVAAGRVLIERGVDLAEDRVLDLPVAEQGVPLIPVTPRITGSDLFPLTVYADLNTENGTFASFGEDPETVGIPPPELLIAGDGASVGATAHGCTAQLPAATDLELRIPTELTATVSRTTATLAFDPGIQWEAVRVTVRQETAIAATRIGIRIDPTWLAVRGDQASTVALPDITALPGWRPELPGDLPAGTLMAATVNLSRGVLDGDLTSCTATTTFTW